MDIVQLLAGLAGIASFVFAVFQYLKNRETRLTETAKLSVQKERMRNIHFNVVAALSSTDQIVQHAKKPHATVESMQEMARMVRTQLAVIENQVRVERGRLSSWRYGELIPSEDLEENSAKPADEDNAKAQPET